MKQENKTIDELIAADKAANETAYKRLKKIALQFETGKYYRVSDGTNVSYLQFDCIRDVGISELIIKATKTVQRDCDDNHYYFNPHGSKYKIEEIPEAFFESLNHEFGEPIFLDCNFL